MRAIGSRRVLVRGDGLLVETVAAEAQRACARFGGTTTHLSTHLAATGDDGDAPEADLVLTLVPQCEQLGDEGFALARTSGNVTTVEAGTPPACCTASSMSCDSAKPRSPTTCRPTACNGRP